ncbi:MULTISPECIES: zinc-binding dehydrogenase [unclassified Paenibacillus]|uniref:zinc-binding dehydrogenase n=1 Tax=unclassified Paenibacillus TaxID=185978 RepID=UPI001AE4A0A4|nr:MULTISPECIES: zinc-binding dehydrogenase [unclassified Paenibacillus]MBP1154652.1 NADPH:quinone reductase-like Zn-dependent oxidoreductase [Paenibacillus sp. PvP091]MBP1169964.1 NADPH:quinone reductase-like Zn-dependent oxidoreductase [Paenibacillus sp. PvR098]MBP2440992.1 NADPH:quinone reductase-like Zn-dependent oxidoreductase [Paenibacillus sp. PvP052]
MKALVLNEPGKPDTLTITELPLPKPGTGEIRVRVGAASLNPIDYKVSLNGHPDWVYPFVLGVDVAGTIDEIGEGVTNWSVGDRIVYHGNFSKPGGYAEYSVTTAHTVAAVPDGISFVEAAAFPCAGLTAYQALHRKMHMQKGHSILIHAGAGGVGGYAIQLAKAFGASNIMTTASPGSLDYVKTLGAHVVIDYNNENVHDRVMEVTDGLGVDLILNSINRVTAQADLSMLAFGGQLACIAGAPETVADFQPSHKTFTVHKLMLGGAHVSGDDRAERDLARMAEEFMKLMLDKKVDPMVNEVISLEQVPEALIRLSQRHVRGKIVVKL